MVCGVARAMAQRAYAIRPYKWCKTNIAKTIFDVGKTMSYVEKITSDIIRITSDFFLPVVNIRKTKTYTVCLF